MAPDPCENTVRFQALEAAVAGIKATTEAGVKAQTDAVDEMKSLGREMRSILGDLRERSARDAQRVDDLAKGVNVLFQFKRHLEETRLPSMAEEISTVNSRAQFNLSNIVEKRIMPIEIKHMREDGARAAFKDFRVLVPSIIAVLLGIIQLFNLVRPWLKNL